MIGWGFRFLLGFFKSPRTSNVGSARVQGLTRRARKRRRRRRKKKKELTRPRSLCLMMWTRLCPTTTFWIHVNASMRIGQADSLTCADSKRSYGTWENTMEMTCLPCSFLETFGPVWLMFSGSEFVHEDTWEKMPAGVVLRSWWIPNSPSFGNQLHNESSAPTQVAITSSAPLQWIS